MIPPEIEKERKKEAEMVSNLPEDLGEFLTVNYYTKGRGKPYPEATIAVALGSIVKVLEKIERKLNCLDLSLREGLHCPL